MSEQTEVSLEAPEEDRPPTQDRRDERTPLWRRILFGAFVGFAVIFFLAALLYRFGSMAPPSTETRAAYEQLAAEGKVPHVTQRQFHIPIPGCTCHSDDPVLVIQHEDRRISECMGCHGR